MMPTPSARSWRMMANSCSRLVGGQRRRRLVHHDDARAMTDSACAISTICRCPTVSVADRAWWARSRARPAPAAWPSLRTSRRASGGASQLRVGSLPEKDVGGDVQVGRQHQLLVNESDAAACARRPRRRRSTGCPAIRISPPSGGWTPPRIFISVLLPAPFSPISASTSPGRASSDTFDERGDAGEALADAAHDQEVGRAPGA